MKEGQARQAVLAMLRKFDEEAGSAAPKRHDQNWPLNPAATTTERKITGAHERQKEEPLDAALEVRRNRRMAKFVEHLPHAEEFSRTDGDDDDDVEANKAAWRLSALGPKIRTLERAPWEEEEEEEEEEEQSTEAADRILERSQSQILENIMEDEEDDETLNNSYRQTEVKTSKLLTPPVDIDCAQSSSPTSYFGFHKFTPSRSVSNPTTPKSITFPVSPVFEYSIPKTPPKSPSTIRTRAGLKKIFLSTLRPRKREDIEPPSPSTSSASTTPSLPTPTIRISSPIHPRRMDGSPIYVSDTAISPTSAVEPKYKLPELRLSRADWGEWGRQIADRL